MTLCRALPRSCGTKRTSGSGSWRRRGRGVRSAAPDPHRGPRRSCGRGLACTNRAGAILLADNWRTRARGGGAFPIGRGSHRGAFGAPASLPKAAACSVADAARPGRLLGVRPHVVSVREHHRTKDQTKPARNRKSGPECPELGDKRTYLGQGRNFAS